MLIASPDKFAEWFNEKYPGTFRQITPEDVKDMTVCNLIYRHGYYSESIDGELIRAILQYERLRHNHQKNIEIKDTEGRIHCKRCGSLLASKLKGKKGRPSEYCPDCEPFRGKERYRKWQKKG